MSECKHHTPRVAKTLRACDVLYKTDGCITGGPLHIWLDDGNCDTDDILFCLKQCQEQPERIESRIGTYICKEYLKMSIEERSVFEWLWRGRDLECAHGSCETCNILKRSVSDD